MALEVTSIDGTINELTAGWLHTCVQIDGGAWCWGRNDYGQLGDGNITTDFSLDAVAPNGLDSGVQSISGGRGHTCVMTENEDWCWGWNNYGQVGNNSTEDTGSPAAILWDGGPTPTPTATATPCVGCDGTIAIDTDPVMPGVQESRTIPTGDSFHIRVTLSELAPSVTYGGYQVKVLFDEAYLEVTGVPESWKDAPTASTGGNVAVLGSDPLFCAGTVEADSLAMGCTASGETSLVQDLVDLMFTCTSEGSSTLVLAPATDPLGTFMITPHGDVLDNTLVGATINCGSQSLTPTATATATATPTATATTIPTATPCSDCTTIIAIDADPNVAGVQDSRIVATGEDLHVRVTLADLESGQWYRAYQAKVLFDEAQLQLTGVPASWEDAPTESTGGNVAVFPGDIFCADSIAAGSISMGCSGTGETSLAQDLVDLVFTCATEGSSTLALAPATDPFGTFLIDENFQEVTATLVDTTIECRDGYVAPSAGEDSTIGPLMPAPGSCSFGVASIDILAPFLALGLLIERRRLSSVSTSVFRAVKRIAHRSVGA